MRKLIIFLIIPFTLMLNSCGAYRAYSNWDSTFSNDIKEMYKVQDVDNRLSNYQWFYDQYNQIQATAANVKVISDEEKTGTLMVLNSMIAEYNSKASQDRNAAKWMGRGLPYNISLSDLGL